MFHVTGHEDEIGTEALRLDRRHRRVDSVLARLVARRGHDTPTPIAPDDDRSSTQLRTVPLLDGGVERVHVRV